MERLEPPDVHIWQTHRPATLASIVGRYVSLDDGGAWLARSRFGRPIVVRRSPGLPRLHVSVSHAAGRSLVAIARRRVGVDLESLATPSRPLDGLLRYLAAEEREAILATPADRRRAILLRCWTLKEAYVKARGRGLRIPLDEFAVGWADQERPTMPRNDRRASEVARWQFASVPVGPTWVASLVVEGMLSRVRLRVDAG